MRNRCLEKLQQAVRYITLGILFCYVPRSEDKVTSWVDGANEPTNPFFLPFFAVKPGEFADGTRKVNILHV